MILIALDNITKLRLCVQHRRFVTLLDLRLKGNAVAAPVLRKRKHATLLVATKKILDMPGH